MTRTTAKYLALLALAITLFYWKTLLTNQFSLINGSEGVSQTYAWLHFWVNSLWHGHVALWDPNDFAGRPFTEEMAGFYPLRLVFALLPLNRNGLISPRLYHEYLAFTHFLGACFMFALLRELRRSHFACFLGACAFAMGGIVDRMMWPQYVESCIWIPAVLLFVVRALRQQNFRRALAEAAAAGLCMGMSILTGGIQFSMMQGICVVTAVLFYAVVSRAHWLRMASIAAVVVLVAGGIGAAQLLPSFEFGHVSIRSITGGMFPMSEKIPFDRMDPGMWPQSIATGLFPGSGAMGGGETWPWYIGVLPLFFACIAIWKCWQDTWVRYLSILALLAFVYSLGEFTPLHGMLYAVTPYLWMARQPSRFLYLVSFPFAALVAFGVDSLLTGAGQRHLWAPAMPYLKWIAIACGIALFLPVVLPQFTIGAWTCLSLLLILASCAWLRHLSLHAASPLVRVAIAVFVLMDLGAFTWLEVNRDESIKSGDAYEQMVSLRRAAEFVRAQPGLHRVRVSVAPEPNIGDVYGVQSLWGDGAAFIGDFMRLIPHEDILNVRYHIKPAATPDAGEIYHDPLWKVYEDKNGYPRAWLVHKIVLEPTHDDVFTRLNTPGIDLHNVAVIEEPLPGALDARATPDDSVRFRSYEADRMSMDVNTADAALLVVSEVFYHGWKATVNGQAVEIRKVDGALRGLVVPRGPSHVVMEYSPTSFYTGIGLTLLTTASVLMAWIPFWRRPS